MRSGLYYRTLIALAIGCYPIFLLAAVMLYLPEWMPAALTAGAAAVSIAALLQGILFHRLERRSRLLGDAAAAAAALLSGGACILLCMMRFPMRVSLICGALLAAAHFLAWKLRAGTLHQLSGISTYTLLCTIHFFVMLYLSVRRGYDAEGCFVSLLLMTLLLGSVRSSLALDKASPHGVHKSARRHNAVLYALLAALGLLAICAVRYFAALVKMAGVLLGKAAFRFLQWLGTITGQETETPVDPTQETSAVTQEAGAGGDIVMLLLTMLLLAGAGILLFRMQHRIADRIRSFFQNALAMFRHLLQGTKTMTDTAQNCEYADYVESIAHRQEAEVRRPDTRSRWNKQYRRFRKLSDPVEAFRCGYGLWLSSLLLRRVEVALTDTPEEVLQKAMQLDDAALCETVTGSYYLVRYACQKPDAEAMQALRELLAQTARQIRRI